MGGGSSSSKPKMIKDPTLEPLRQDLVGYLGAKSQGGTEGLSLPQYSGSYGTSATPLNMAAQNTALSAIQNMKASPIEGDLNTAFKTALSGTAAPGVDDIVADMMRRSSENQTLNEQKLNEQFGAAGGRFASPLAIASGESNRKIAADTTGQIAGLRYGAQNDALNRMISALAPGVDYASQPPELKRALLAAQLAEQAGKPQETEIDRRMAENARTQAALLPFAIQMASAFPPVGSSTKSVQGGIL